MIQKIKIRMTSAFIFICINSYSQVQVEIQLLQYTNNGQSTVTVSDCGTIALGTSTSTSINFGIKLTKPVNQAVGDGNVKVFTKKSSSDFELVAQGPIAIFANQWGGNPSIANTSATFTINAANFNVSGGTLYAVYTNSSNAFWSSCPYAITKTPLPTFTLSPSTVSVGCNDLNPRTFSVTAANIPAGANVVYQWSAPGWSGTSNTSSITLAPSSPTVLPSTITVTPFINGVSQTPRTCTVTRESFSSNATISGTQNICTGTANYSIAGITAGQNVLWSLSNAATASIISSSNTGATISFNGTGAQTLTATIRNACNQQVVKTFVINSGSTTFSTTATLIGSTTAACSGTRVFSINNLAAGLTVSWSVSDTSVASLSGMTNTQATLTIIGNGSVSIIATITNSCGQSTTRTATLYGGAPVLTSFTCDPQGKPFCGQGQISEYTSNIPSLNLNDRVTAIFSGQTSAEANLNTNWQWQALNNKIILSGGTRNFRNVGCVTFGTTGLQVRARNACGWSEWYPLNWELVEVPDSIQRSSEANYKLTVFPNPSNGFWSFSFQNTTIESIIVIDVNGKKLYNTTPSENQVTIDCSSFQKGIYFAKVKTVLGIETVKLVKK